MNNEDRYYFLGLFNTKHKTNPPYSFCLQFTKKEFCESIICCIIFVEGNTVVSTLI